MKKKSSSIIGRTCRLQATPESNPYNLTKTVDFAEFMPILYLYEALTQLPLLVACEFIIRGAWRANSETDRKVSLFILIPVFPNILHSNEPASLQSKEVSINTLNCLSAHVQTVVDKFPWAVWHVLKFCRAATFSGIRPASRIGITWPILLVAGRR